MPPPSSSRIRRALISVSDKTDLVEFGRFLSGNGIEVLSTGGTANVLRDAGVQVTEVSDHTGFPEILDGRVKTLQPLIHGGLLAKRGDPDHQRAMDELGIAPIDLLAVNLYPFEATVAEGADFDTCVENIDIGGPAMIRAAAKNHESVTVVVDPADYGVVMKEMKANGGATTASFRKRLAAKAYARTGAYDAAIGGWFNERVGETFPGRVDFGGNLGTDLRQAENPDQQADFERGGECRPGVASAEQIQGKELSYNNFNDTDAAFELVAEFEPTALAIIKHANPCGVAVSATLVDAYAMALACDPESAFGGIVACNRALDAATAEEIVKLFIEVVIAPEVDPAARKILAAKENLRVLVTGAMPDAAAPGMSLKSLAGGFLLQGRDNAVLDEMKVVTQRAPTEAEMADLKFAFTVCKHVKSNAIVYAKNKTTVGIGAGQTSRVNSSRVATWKAEDAARAAGEKTSRAAGSVVASDAFFPFADGLLAAAGAGVTAIIQPGGSRRDGEVIAAADERGLAMVFTGMRHFRH